MTDSGRLPTGPSGDEPAEGDRPAVPLDAVLRAFGSRRPDRRRAAVLALGRRDNATAHVQEFVEALRDPDQGVRAAAVRVLRRTRPDDPALLDALASVLGQLTANELRDAAAVLLPHPGYTAAVVGRLAAALGGDDSTVAVAAQATVRRLKAIKTTVRHLTTWLADPGGRDLLDAVRMLRLLGPRAHRAIPALLATLALPGTRPVLREWIIDALAEVGPGHPSVREAFYAALEDTSPGVRVAAAAALSRTPGAATDGVRVLVETLSGGPGGWELVHYTLRPVAERLGDATPELTAALADGLRSAAAADRARYADLIGKLGKSGLRSAVLGQALAGAVADSAREVRWEVAYALGRVEPYTRATADALAALARDPADDVRTEAGFSIDRVVRYGGAYPDKLPRPRHYHPAAAPARTRRRTGDRAAPPQPAGIARMAGVVELIPALQDFYAVGAVCLGADDGEFSIRGTAGRLDTTVPTLRGRLTQATDFFRAYFERFGHPPHRGPFRAAADADELAADGDKIIERSARRRPRICEPVGRWAWELTRDFLANVSALPGGSPGG
jgi:HEAT repeat protein